MATSNSNFQFPGADLVRQWFGSWPDFHDAEIISLTLSRRDESVLRVYPYAPEKPATVEFLLNEITDLQLADFSNQNVIRSLTIEQVSAKQGESVIRIKLHPCYGLAGHLDAKEIRVNLRPGKSMDGASQW
jgi:hypothetical protein